MSSIPSSSTAPPAATAASPPSEPRGASSSEATKARLLDAAERLFVRRGFEGASMRAVTRAAGTSVSAANYHFGSKEALLQAALARRVEPLNERRSARLAALAAADDTRLESVVDAFLRPPLELRGERVRAGGDPEENAQLAFRMLAEPAEVMAPMRRQLFARSREEFLAAFARALPGAAPGDVELAVMLTTGVMVHLLGGFASDETPVELLEATDYEPLLARMVAFASAGIRALTGLDAVGGAR